MNSVDEQANRLTETLGGAFLSHRITLDDCRRIVAEVLKTTRQEALREARDYALACVAERNKQAFEMTKTVLNDPRAVWLGCKASEAERIAEWIDRLASEGGLGC